MGGLEESERGWQGEKKGRTELTRQCTLDSQTNSQYHHEHLVSHRINDGTDNGALIPPPCDPAIEQVRDPGVGKEAQGRGMIVVHDAVSDKGRNHQARGRQDVGDRVNVLSRQRRLA